MNVLSVAKSTGGVAVYNRVFCAGLRARGYEVRTVCLSEGREDYAEELRALGIPDVRSPGEARALARALGADAILVGSITAWHPYEPQRIGLNLALYARTSAMSPEDVDPIQLRHAVTDSQITPGAGAGDLPLSAVAEVLDASNHGVVADVRRYARGRHDPRSAIGDEIYLKSMERYTQFACFRMVESLLRRERSRLTLADAAQ